MSTFKLYVLAIAGIPIGIYCLAPGEWFGAGALGGSGVAALSYLLRYRGELPVLVGLFFQTFDLSQ